MIKYGNLIAFICFLLACTYMEVKANGAGDLWVLVVLWVIFGNFTDRKEPLITVEKRTND